MTSKNKKLQTFLPDVCIYSQRVNESQFIRPDFATTQALQTAVRRDEMPMGAIEVKLHYYLSKGLDTKGTEPIPKFTQSRQVLRWVYQCLKGFMSCKEH